MGSILSVLITAGLGTWLAYVWQQRTAKQARFFDSSKTQFELMRGAAASFSDLIGKRLYAMHRVCLLSSENEQFEQAFENLVRSIEDWNNGYLQIELNVRTLFVHSTANELEELQSKLNKLSNKVIESVKNKTSVRNKSAHDVALLRYSYFRFLQSMTDEADKLFRQMHFGIKLDYNANDISFYSTLDLVNILFSGSEDESSVIRSPTDFGLPVNTRDSRLRVN